MSPFQKSPPCSFPPLIKSPLKMLDKVWYRLFRAFRPPINRLAHTLLISSLVSSNPSLCTSAVSSSSSFLLLLLYTGYSNPGTIRKEQGTEFPVYMAFNYLGDCRLRNKQSQETNPSVKFKKLSIFSFRSWCVRNKHFVRLGKL